MEDHQYDALLDVIYEAALEPERWTDVLESLTDLVEGDSAWLAWRNPAAEAVSGLVARIDPAMQDLYFRQFARSDPFVTPMQGTGRVELLTDEDFLSKADLVRSEFYNDFMRPMDVHSIAALRFGTVDALTASIHINRSLAAGPFSEASLARLRCLGHHLSRSITMSRKIGLRDPAASNAVAVLDRARHGVLIFTSNGLLQHANKEAECIFREHPGLGLSSGRLSLASPDLSKRLNAMIDATAAGVPLATSALMAPAADGSLSLSFTVSPLSRRHGTLFGDPGSVLVCVSDLNTPTKSHESHIRALFSLTGAEARVALAILDGLTIAEAAEHLNLSLQTVRNQLKRVFEKIGVNRQAELVRRLMQSAPPMQE